jgi:2-oxoisovalerate dehydrogenase E1 component
MADAAELQRPVGNAPDPDYDWRRIAYLIQVSRALDKLEETRLVPERKISYQFSPVATTWRRSCWA